ncbi:Phospholipase D [Candidatus Westeberhardia cardiocondylae]|uniref:phospholipase D n=1 Tax=Candidatus Westeberhardia cardiocondylae TaxID=1594731 RepID=A0A0H5BWU3_9ENTR|nr:phospholipase D family protein [Candidatus Westeberhardia cardiocondylae]CEN32210.1 Phospholipase D [Candidatus Westeberhardia cardiocondylae]
MKKTKIVSVFFILYIILVQSTFGNEKTIVGFSPGDTAKKIILDSIKNSKFSINIAAYSFTSKQITLALIDAQKRGVKIRIVADKKSNTGKYTAITYLVNHQIPVKLNDKYSIMHNKFMIFDDVSVQTGSFNYTNNAVSRNAENVICLINQPKIANKYILEFNRLWNESKNANPNINIGKNFSINITKFLNKNYKSVTSSNF